MPFTDLSLHIPSLRSHEKIFWTLIRIELKTAERSGVVDQLLALSKVARNVATNALWSTHVHTKINLKYNACHNTKMPIHGSWKKLYGAFRFCSNKVIESYSTICYINLVRYSLIWEGLNFRKNRLLYWIYVKNYIISCYIKILY